MRSLVLGTVAAVLLAPTLACSAESADRTRTSASDAADAPAAAALPALRVRAIARDLDHPWDVKPIGPGRFLVTERDRAQLTLVEGGQKRAVDFRGRVWVSGETGLMGLEVDPGFSKNRRFYTCQGATLPGGGHDVRVVAWKLSEDGTRAVRRKNLLTGLPASSGRHGGCRLLITRNGSLLVGTGDAATTGVPRNLNSLGGKTLRLNRVTGKPWRTNPFFSGEGRKRYVQTYGHRNVQGLAERKDGTLWSVEHGSYRDDEVNLLRNGGDYGWQPGPGYNESPPMTDQSLPGRQVPARWRSGTPTIAPSGADFTRGKAWGRLRGAMAVGVLGDEELLFLKFNARGRLQFSRTPNALDGDYGRLRGVTSLRNGDLLVTTDNGGGNDRVLRVTPRG